MNKTAFILALIAVSAFAKDDARTTYVGQGRYTCSGSSAACAQIDQNNRQAEQLRQMNDRYEQDRVQAAVERERRLQEQDRRNYGR